MDKTFHDLKDMLRASYPLIQLVSSEYNRSMQKLRRIAFELGYSFHSWDNVEGLQTHTRTSSNRLDQVEKHKAYGETKDYQGLLEYLKRDAEAQQDANGEIYLLEDFHKYFKDDKVIVYLRKLTNLFKLMDRHLVIMSPYVKLPEEIEKYVTIVNVPLPNKEDLKKRLSAVLQSDDINPDLEDYIIDAALGMTDTEAELAFKLAKEKVGLQSKEAARIVSNEKKQIIKKSGILDYYEVNQDLDSNVGGLDRLKTWLRQRNKAFERKAKSFGLKEPKGILLLGVPGCGKSLTAKCVATEWKQPLLRLDIGKVFQAEVGSSENNIRMAIATAEAVAPCVLWIDEIEKGLQGSSGGEKDGGTNSRVFSTILTWMQEKTKPVFVVATANNISDLPPELLRKGRFDEIFFVDLPTEKEREDIFEIHLKRYNQHGITDLHNLAKKSKYFNGAEIEEVVKEAMFLSYVENPDNNQVSILHLEEAIREIVPLSQTMRRKIDGLRDWASSRARLASAELNEEKLEVDQNNEDSYEKGLTKQEKQEDIF